MSVSRYLAAVQAATSPATGHWFVPSGPITTLAPSVGSVSLNASGSVTQSTNPPLNDGHGAVLGGTQELDSASAYSFAPGARAVSLWFKTSAPGGLFSTDGDLTASPAGTTDQLYVGSDNKLYWSHYNGGALNTLTSSGTVNDGNWHHVVAILLSTSFPFTMKLYLDGILVGTTANFNEFEGTQSLYCRFGWCATSGWTNSSVHALTGELADITLWVGSTPSAADVLSLYRQGFNHFSSVPYRNTSNPALFNKLMNDAWNGIKYIGAIGTSIFTGPGGAGEPNLENLQAAFNLAYGGMGATPLVTQLQQSVAQFCATGSNGGASTGTNSSFSGTALPPNVSVLAVKSTDAGYSIQFSPTFGMALAPSDATIKNNLSWTATSNLQVQFYMGGFSGSATNLQAQNIPINSGDNPFFSTASNTYTTNLTALNASPSVQTWSVAASLGAKTGVSCVLNTTDASKSLNIIGARMLDLTHPWGVTVDSLSQGGLASGYWLSQGATCGYVLSQLGYSAYIIAAHGNDFPGYTPDQSYASIQSIITFIRQAHASNGKPAPLFYVTTDSPRSADGTTANQRVLLADIGYQLSLTNGDVMHINLYRMLYDMNWTETTAGTFTNEGTHPSIYAGGGTTGTNSGNGGSQLFGHSLAKAMMTPFDASSFGGLRFRTI